jgi:hypothetical protein
VIYRDDGSVAASIAGLPSGVPQDLSPHPAPLKSTGSTNAMGRTAGAGGGDRAEPGFLALSWPIAAASATLADMLKRRGDTPRAARRPSRSPVEPGDSDRFLEHRRRAETAGGDDLACVARVIDL